MEPSLTLVLVAIVALVILRFAKKLFLKVLGVLLLGGLILGFLYYKGIGPFEQNVADMNHLMQKYCGDDGDEDICECILKPAQEDINSRFTRSELDSLTNQKIKGAYVLQKSLKATKEKALVCLASKDATSKYKVFLQDFVPIENKYLDLIGDKARDLSDKVKEEISSLKEDKKDIDDKY
ncbi:MAG: hypothetical protein ACPGYY_04010 [Bacteroidia bacterium]